MVSLKFPTTPIALSTLTFVKGYVLRNTFYYTSTIRPLAQFAPCFLLEACMIKQTPGAR